MRLDFDPDSVPARGHMEPGWHQAMVIKEELKTSKANADNRYLELTLELMEPPGKGRKVWERLNLWNANPTAVQIAMEALAELTKAAGVTGKLGDTSELFHKPVMVQLQKQEGSNDRFEPVRYDSVSRKAELMAAGTGAPPPAGGSALPPPGGQPSPVSAATLPVPPTPAPGPAQPPPAPTMPAAAPQPSPVPPQPSPADGAGVAQPMPGAPAPPPMPAPPWERQ